MTGREHGDRERERAGTDGVDLARSCTRPASLVNAYSSVIQRFGVTKVDFDVEGAALTQRSSVTRRFSAVKAPEKKYPALQVSVTVPVGPAAWSRRGWRSSRARRRRAPGSTSSTSWSWTTATAATWAPRQCRRCPGTLKQLKAVWPASTYANLGITPMIGQNDTSSEVFTYDDAETLVQFARANGVRRLAFWSLNRDQACGPDDTLGSSFSGLRQDPLDYTDALRG